MKIDNLLRTIQSTRRVTCRPRGPTHHGRYPQAHRPITGRLKSETTNGGAEVFFAPKPSIPPSRVDFVRRNRYDCDERWDDHAGRSVRRMASFATHDNQQSTHQHTISMKGRPSPYQMFVTTPFKKRLWQELMTVERGGTV